MRKHISHPKSLLCWDVALRRWLQSSAGDSRRVQRDIAGCAGTKCSSNSLLHPQSTKNAPEHRQNPTAFQTTLRKGISERVVSGVLKQSHCGQGRILINSFLSLISIFFLGSFSNSPGSTWVRPPPPPACVPAARCHRRYRSRTRGCDGWLHLGLMASSEA